MSRSEWPWHFPNARPRKEGGRGNRLRKKLIFRLAPEIQKKRPDQRQKAESHQEQAPVIEPEGSGISSTRGCGSGDQNVAPLLKVSWFCLMERLPMPQMTGIEKSRLGRVAA
jgi:hypothetical protein